MTAMDTRLAERRKGVSEDKARKRLKWVLLLLLVVLLGVGIYWLVHSPLLSISEVEVTGALESDPAAYVDALAMGIGTPTMDVDSGAIGARVLADPWIADARVSVLWPGTIVIDVIEHQPIVSAPKGDLWYRIALGGWVVAERGAPGPSEPVIAIDLGSTMIGEASEDPLIAGAIEFIETLAPDLREGAVVTAEDGGLFADVAGHVLRLGRPVEMATKAIVFEGLYAMGLAPGARVDLIAPTRPAVANPQPQVEAEE